MQQKAMGMSNAALVNAAVADAIARVATHNGDIGDPTIAASTSAFAKAIDKEMSVYAYTEYSNIFRSFTLPPTDPLQEDFLSCWGDYEEVVNIMPSANILTNGAIPVGTLNDGDGLMIREALNVRGVANSRRPRFFTLTDGAHFAAAVAPAGLNLTDGTGNPLPPNRFICFSQEDSTGCFKTFHRLNAAIPPAALPGMLSEQDQFRGLVGQLLNKITIDLGAARQCGGSIGDDSESDRR
jgi:hypothetical protein